MSKFKEFISDELLICEIKLDFSNLSHIKEKIINEDYIIYMFDDISVEFHRSTSGKSEWMLKFGKSSMDDKIESIELTNDHNIAKVRSVLEGVIKCLYIFSEKYKPDQLTFDADRPSRVKMYERIVKTVYTNSNFIQYYIAGKEQGTGHTFFIIKRKGYER